MKKILFVCHGNICRSTMADYVMKHLVKQCGAEEGFLIDSAATSREEIGNGVHHGTRRKLAEMAKSFGLYKGQMVGVSGMLDMDVYTDKNNIPRTSLTLDVEDIDFIRTTDMPAQTPARGEADDTTDVPAMVAAQDPDCPF